MTWKIILLTILISFSAIAADPSNNEEIDVIAILGGEAEDEPAEKIREDISVDEALNNEFKNLDAEPKPIETTDTKIKEDKAVLEIKEEAPKKEEPIMSEANYKNFALIRVLNKITTKSAEIKISKNKINNFGKLSITLSYCWQTPPDIETENKAYLEIYEQLNNTTDLMKIFSGWLLSSSPSISAVEHPIYDIHLLRCF